MTVLILTAIGLTVSFTLIGNSEDETAISGDRVAFPGFPYKSHFAELEGGAKMHYLDEGKGQPIILIHGVPTSSFLWRNVIPHLTPHGRVIAIDLMSFGKSDKLPGSSEVPTQVHYLSQLIERLQLEDVRLIVHESGGPV